MGAVNFLITDAGTSSVVWGIVHFIADSLGGTVTNVDGSYPAGIAGHELAPFGLCHSEFHPTSLHIRDGHYYLLDLARAFTGPGLLDLASWHGTITDPDPARTHDLIESYVAAGGPRQARVERGGLDAASWALGWHRVWIADWFTSQIGYGWAEGAEDTWTTAITRHLTEAAWLLRA